MRETIQLEAEDGVFAVRQLLEESGSRQVALVVPSGNSILRSEASLGLIRRFAESLAVDLILVSGDRVGLERAHAVGLRTAGSAADAQGMSPKRPGLPLLLRPVAIPASLPSIEALRARVAGLQLRLPQKRSQQIGLVAVALAVALALLVILMVVVPSAEVSLDPQGERQSAQIEVVASTGLEQVDYEQRQVPARQVSIEVVGEENGQTTGKTSSAGDHATGEVVFANRTTDAIVIPKGTAVRTVDGDPVRFYTLLDVEVPGSYGATARAPIMAFEPGPVGNVGALTIRAVEGEAGYKVEALNDKATHGGNDKRISTVSLEDNDRLRASLMQRLQQQANDLLVQQLEVGEWVPPDSMEVVILDEAFDKKVDEPADTLRLTMKVRVSGLAVQGQGTRALMSRLLEAQASSGKGQASKGLVVNDATLQVEQPVGKASVSGQSVSFQVSAEALLVPAIDLRTVSKGLAGRVREDALSWLAAQYNLREAPQIRIRPSWWPRLPWLASHIKVTLSGGL